MTFAAPDVDAFASWREQNNPAESDACFMASCPAEPDQTVYMLLVRRTNSFSVARDGAPRRADAHIPSSRQEGRPLLCRPGLLRQPNCSPSEFRLSRAIVLCVAAVVTTGISKVGVFVLG